MMNRTFTFVKASEDSLPKQARTILNIVEAKSPITEAALIQQIQLDVKSKQEAKRLLTYYKGPLINKGLIEETRHG